MHAASGSHSSPAVNPNHPSKPWRKKLLSTWLNALRACVQGPNRIRPCRKTRHAAIRTRLAIEAMEERTLPSGGLPFVVTELPDYAPGQRAAIFAGNFQVGETVDFLVNNQTNGNVYAPWSVKDGSADDLDGVVDGHIQTSWLVVKDAAN